LEEQIAIGKWLETQGASTELRKTRRSDCSKFPEQTQIRGSSTKEQRHAGVDRFGVGEHLRELCERTACPSARSSARDG
jgi:hypothetical protein